VTIGSIKWRERRTFGAKTSPKLRKGVQ
jgi:hypothetical protein